jgi:hypothetical protein
MASVLVKRPGGKLRLYNKGAAEMVLTHCTSMVGPRGEAVPMTEVSEPWAFWHWRVPWHDDPAEGFCVCWLLACYVGGLSWAGLG